MPNCPSCGKKLPGEFSFCPFCAAPLTERATASVQEERKVVTVLFCDLVGFTAASEAADPEDVLLRIRPYHTRLRRELEAYGGTVEKFIGDAVMAVFGAPTAHEDDAERAVRAGLRILEAIEELNESDPALSLQVRIGINTGEAVVELGARPEEGAGFVTGDVVNTASRLQGAAPVNEIVCSEQTCRQTERIFDYEELEPVAVKGKAEALAVFRPLQARARFGSDVARTHAAPLVGRELEKSLLIATFERSAQQRSCQLVTLVGEPGIGKSRLCAELFGYIEDRPDLVRWRQGRCLPYGEGIAFWALGEIVKAECGILESDTPADAEAKLTQALPRDDPDYSWLKARLQPLVGAGGEPASQEESFTAWRHYLASWAEVRATILVFEDLHWADDHMLAFLEHLADWSEAVPLLLLCTARPELHEQHPAWAAGLRNSTTINLASLTDEETARLIAILLDRVVLPAMTQHELLERAGGNPLYAEEFVRLVAERDKLAEVVEVPDSVQALIAARLDTLSAERKGLLQDAAVLGKVFWSGALAEMGGREPREVELALHELSRKELVRRARTSSMEGEAEYGFWHVLVRDVCYAQIPRAARASRHRAAAFWLERQAGERAEDMADVLAYHYLTALELARAAGRTLQARELEPDAIRALALAGERALPLDVDRAEQSLAAALELAPADHPERASLLERWARGAQQQGRLQEAKEALEEALAVHREHAEPLAAGRVLAALSLVLNRLGDPRAEKAIIEALALLEPEPNSPELVAAHAELAGRRIIGSAFPEAIVAAERALALADELGVPTPPRALGARGYARCYLNEREGMDDMREALEFAVDHGRGRDAAILHNNLALAIWLYQGPQAGLERCHRGIEFCERRGISEVALGIAAMRLTFLADLGHVDMALAEAEPLAKRLQAAGDVYFTEPRSLELRLLVERGVHEHTAVANELVATARKSGVPQDCADPFAAAAQLLLAQGRTREAKALLTELEQVAGIRADPYYASALPALVRNALKLGEPELAARLVEGVESSAPLFDHVLITCRAQLVEAAGTRAEGTALYVDTAERWREFGNVPERAYALLGQGRCLAAVGKPEAEEPLREARELFAAMGYGPALAETERLLGGRETAAL